MFGTLKSPVAALNVEPRVGATVCVSTTLPVVAVSAPFWSLLRTFNVTAVPNGVFTLSLMASITLIATAVVLFKALPSLVALVAPFTPTLVCAVSVPPAVPGIVTVNGHVIVPFASTLAALLPALNTQAPGVTVAPAGTPGAAVHVALVAAVVADTLVQVNVPFNTAPGPAVNGKPVIATLMSAAAPTTMVAVAVSHAAGTGAGFAQIW